MPLTDPRGEATDAPPAARRWALSDAPRATRPFTDLAERETVPAERGQARYAHPEWVRGPRFGWWPQPLAPSAASCGSFYPTWV